jgi:uncharacterized protein (UPF0147 family)
MEIDISNSGYYKMTMQLCEEDLREVRTIMAGTIDDLRVPVYRRAVAQRIVTLMDKQQDMPK